MFSRARTNRTASATSRLTARPPWLAVPTETVGTTPRPRSSLFGDEAFRHAPSSSLDYLLFAVDNTSIVGESLAPDAPVPPPCGRPMDPKELVRLSEHLPSETFLALVHREHKRIQANKEVAMRQLDEGQAYLEVEAYPFMFPSAFLYKYIPPSAFSSPSKPEKAFSKAPPILFAFSKFGQASSKKVPSIFASSNGTNVKSKTKSLAGNLLPRMSRASSDSMSIHSSSFGATGLRSTSAPYFLDSPKLAAATFGKDSLKKTTTTSGVVDYPAFTFGNDSPPKKVTTGFDNPASNF